MRLTAALAIVFTMTSACELDRTGVGAGATPRDAGRIDASTGDASPNDGGSMDATSSDATSSDDDGGVDAGEPLDAGCDRTACPGRRCDRTGCLHYASCDALHRARPSEPSGVYEIDPDGGGPLRVYCDMIPGGGWTLILKADGNQSTFDYYRPVWTDSNLLNPDSLDLSETEAKLETFERLALAELRVGLKVGGTIRWTTMSVSAGSMNALMNGPHAPSSVGRAAWLALVPGSGLQPNCNREGVNVETGAMDVRIGIVGNNESDCRLPDSFLGIGANVPFEACDDPFDTTVGNGSACGPHLEIFAWGFVLGR